MADTATQPYFSEKRKIITESIHAFKAWPVWLHMGLQDMRNQFRRSRLGVSWVLINLSLMAGAIGYVYGHLFQQDLSTFFPLLISGLILWNFISSTIVQGCQTFIISEGYVKQFSMPKQVYILRFFLTAFLNLAIGFIVFFLVALSQHIHFGWGSLWAIPGIMILATICLGHLFIFSYWGVKIRDLAPALSSVFMILFYVTPIVFTPSMLESRNLAFIYKFNPLYYLIEIVRYPLLNAQMPNPEIYFLTLCYGAFIWVFALFTLFTFDRKVAYWL